MKTCQLCSCLLTGGHWAFGGRAKSTDVCGQCGPWYWRCVCVVLPNAGVCSWPWLFIPLAEYVRRLEDIVSHKLELLSKFNGKSGLYPCPPPPQTCSPPSSERIRDLHQRLKEEETASEGLKRLPPALWPLYVTNNRSLGIFDYPLEQSLQTHPGTKL